MKSISKFIRVFCAVLLLFAVLPEAVAKDFVVVIDAGHGGHDPGAIGKISREKDINLKVALRLGQLIRDNCADTKVIYTRSKDVFVRLDRRAQIANDAKADLFISIHTNSVAGSKTAMGASTWTLGLARSDANLAVAKRENSVILYEDDYKTTYAGFNPNSAESYIIFEFMQDQYMEQSVHLASLIQKQFKNSCGRQDRGVHQAGFLVLKASAMPSVLVELGFISTPQEERYLNTEKGVSELARGIYRAFVAYKDEQLKRAKGAENLKPASAVADKNVPENVRKTPEKAEPEPEVRQAAEKPSQSKTSVKQSGRPVFKIQIMASDRKLAQNDRRLKGLKGVSFYKERGFYKYTYGESENYTEIVRLKKRVVDGKFKDAFIIAFKNGKKMNVQQAIREFKQR